MAQRYVTGLQVFDTYTGLLGDIVQMNLNSGVISNPYTSLYTGMWFVVQLSSGSMQLFTNDGNRVDHTTGAVTTGATLLTFKEYVAALAAGYPAA